MNKTNTPYELRAELLNRAIDVVEKQYDVAFQIAISNFTAITNTITDAWDWNNSNFQEVKKELEDVSKKYENVIDDALKLAAKMNEFVSSKE